MTNVIPFQPNAPTQTASLAEDCFEPVEARPAFSFDMTQPDSKGLVLLDACVPMALAIEFMKLVTAFAEPALA
jgi:hypothetical protein